METQKNPKRLLWLFPIALFMLISFSINTNNHKPLTSKKMIKLIPVRDSIYMLEGRGGNIGVLVGKDGMLLVDDQFDHAHEAISSKLSEINDKDVTYIINTHWHFDHSEGNKKFGKLGSIIIAQENSRKRMTNDQLIQIFNYHQKPYDLDGLPKITFENKMDLHFNKEHINLVSVKNAHTDGDLFVHFTHTNVIHTGDVFVTYGYPFIDQPNGGTIQGVISAINKILSKCDENTLIIPGHGHLSSKKDLLDYKEMLETIFNRVKKEFLKGKSINEIIANHPTRGFSSQKINEAIFVEIIVNCLKSINE